MKANIDDVFNQIINIKVNAFDGRMLKDIKLNLQERNKYDISMSYSDAYFYLCDCLLIDRENNNSEKLLDVFLIHQYLNYCYLSKDVINNLIKESDDLNISKKIVRESFFSYRIVGAFQACTEQYEILRESNLWQKMNYVERMQIMKDSAKSYRNIGDFINSLKLYYDCLMLNPKKDWLQRVELLLKIGKVYRNYLMQIELARFYVEEAYAILKENRIQATYEEKELRYTVICLDTLGQIYRDEHNYEKAAEFFKMSKELYGRKGGRAYIHEILMKYQTSSVNVGSNLTQDIEFLMEAIIDLEKNPMEELGIGVRSVQLGNIIYKDALREKKEAYRQVYRGRNVAYRYNDMKTVIRSYMTEAGFLKNEKKHKDYIKVSNMALQLASDNNQLVLENNIIKEIIEFSNITPDILDSPTKIELIKRRKDIYQKLVEFSRFSIDIVRKDSSNLFSKDKLIDMYGIVLDDFEQILGELSTIIEILNIEIEKINQKYIAYLNMEIKGFTYKSILHKFKNDLPSEVAINQLRIICNDIEINRPESRKTLFEINGSSGVMVGENHPQPQCLC